MATLNLQEISSGTSLDDTTLNNNINLLNTVPLTGTTLNNIPTFSPNTYISAESINNVFTKIKENWIDTSNGTADAGDILDGEIAYVDGKSVMGTIPIRTSSNVTAEEATVTIPAGYYASNVNKSVTTATQATPSVSIDSTGLITASATQTAGYVSAGTKKITEQLPTQAAKKITPSGMSQTAVAAGKYTTGDVIVNPVPTQSKTVTPTTSTQRITPDDTSKFLASVTVAAVPTQTKTANLSTSEQTITPDSGKFLSSVTIVPMPTVEQATPSISVNSSGLITARSAQPSGYVSAGTTSSTKQLKTQAAKTITPSSSQQTAVVRNVYTTGDVTVAAVPTQTKSVTPTTSAQTVTPDSGKYLTSVSVGAIPNTYVKPTATKAATTYTPTTSKQTIAAGTYCSGAQTIAAVPTQTKKVTPNVSAQIVTPDNGKFLSSVTVNAIPKDYVKPAYFIAATTYTPTTTEQNIPANTYCLGRQTIEGDAHLVAGNIKSGVDIFGVPGTYTNDATVTENDMAEGVIAYANGRKVEGNISTITSGRGIGPSGTVSMLTSNGVPTSIEIKGTFTSDRLFRSGSYVAPYVAISNFGDATAGDVASGKTFTSSAGLKVTGTGGNSGGWTYVFFSTISDQPSDDVVSSVLNNLNLNSRVRELDVTLTKEFSEAKLIYATGFSEDTSSQTFVISPSIKSITGRDYEGMYYDDMDGALSFMVSPGIHTYPKLKQVSIQFMPFSSNSETLIDYVYGYIAVKF